MVKRTNPTEQMSKLLPPHALRRTPSFGEELGNEQTTINEI